MLWITVCFCLSAILFLLATLELPTPPANKFVPLGLFFLAVGILLEKIPH
jgi:hypothetical protein